MPLNKLTLDALERNVSGKSLFIALNSFPKSGLLAEWELPFNTKSPKRYFVKTADGNLVPMKAAARLAQYNSTFSDRETIDNNYNAHTDTYKAFVSSHLNGTDFQLLDLQVGKKTNSAEKRLNYYSVLARPNQSEFRKRVLENYGTCVISGTKDASVLQAAHIKPFSEGGDDTAENGILLRSDIHLLFDQNLVAINPKNGNVWVSNDLSNHYTTFHGAQSTINKSSFLKRFKKRWKCRHECD